MIGGKGRRFWLSFFKRTKHRLLEVVAMEQQIRTRDVIDLWGPVETSCFEIIKCDLLCP